MELNPVMKTPSAAREHVGIRIGAAEWRVKRPAGIDAAAENCVESETRSENVDVPAEQIQARKREIARANHHGHQKISEHGGNTGNHEKENHHEAVHGEKLVVRFGLHECALRREQMQPHQHRRRASDEKHKCDGDEIQQRDALVIDREKPRAPAIIHVEIIYPRLDGQFHCGGAHFAVLS